MTASTHDRIAALLGATALAATLGAATTGTASAAEPAVHPASAQPGAWPAQPTLPPPPSSPVDCYTDPWAFLYPQCNAPDDPFEPYLDLDDPGF